MTQKAFLEWLKEGKWPDGVPQEEATDGGYLVPEFVEASDPKSGLYWRLIAGIADRWLNWDEESHRAWQLWRSTRCSYHLVPTIGYLKGKAVEAFRVKAISK